MLESNRREGHHAAIFYFRTYGRIVTIICGGVRYGAAAAHRTNFLLREPRSRGIIHGSDLRRAVAVSCRGVNIVDSNAPALGFAAGGRYRSPLHGLSSRPLWRLWVARVFTSARQQATGCLPSAAHRSTLLQHVVWLHIEPRTTGRWCWRAAGVCCRNFFNVCSAPSLHAR